MPKIAKGRRVGQAAVNALRTLLEEHDHIVQEISGQNDFGEDLYVTFTDKGDVTSDVIKIQVKGGNRWRRANGYAVPVGEHGDTWANGNIPVYCVVYDADNRRLCWANATQQLRRAGSLNPPRVIGVSPNAVLDDTTMESFVAQARRYVGRYRGRQAVLTHLGEMSGVDFDVADHVLHFTNGYDEDLIFWKRPGESIATLLLSAHEWEPYLVSLESLMRSEIPQLEDETGGSSKDRQGDFDLSTAEDLELSQSETMWVISCFISTRQADEGAEDLIDPGECEGCSSCSDNVEHANIAVDDADSYVIASILERIEAEPDLLDRSILAMREDDELDPEIVAELGPLEADPRIVRQVTKLSRARLEDTAPEAFRLALLYLIRRIYVFGPSLPLEEQVRIEWRIPKPGDAASQ
ncbi:DUF4365 domain-containing protein [Kribbella sp. NPDC026596]|uniref:DUF4365 domain-containing protein n=1 Tax=Kribbella sp. NPDC026596 TaxID=3155122 RepID=UPI00340DE8F4